MIYTHNIHPIIVSIGPVDLYWYGAMYAISFLLIDYLMKREVVRDTTLELNVSFIDQIVFISIVSVIIGGRLGYVLFYNIEYYAENFNKIFYIWEGGMSFHGALVGVYFGLLFLSITNKIKFFKLSDFLVPFIPIGLFLGRTGNFINSELYGSPTNASWGVVFPLIDSVPRHPSMLYEAFLEGIVLYLLLFLFKKTKPSTGILTAIFLIFYSLFRFCVEFVRVPDQHIGYIYSTWLTTGMILCVPMFFIGMLIYYYSKKGRI
jgi:phosphatidylglycerol---prolipoprotein diacylglyceryl transferase